MHPKHLYILLILRESGRVLLFFQIRYLYRFMLNKHIGDIDIKLQYLVSTCVCPITYYIFTEYQTINWRLVFHGLGILFVEVWYMIGVIRYKYIHVYIHLPSTINYQKFSNNITSTFNRIIIVPSLPLNKEKGTFFQHFSFGRDRINCNETRRTLW